MEWIVTLLLIGILFYQHAWRFKGKLDNDDDLNNFCAEEKISIELIANKNLYTITKLSNKNVKYYLLNNRFKPYINRYALNYISWPSDKFNWITLKTTKILGSHINNTGFKDIEVFYTFSDINECKEEINKLYTNDDGENHSLPVFGYSSKEHKNLNIEKDVKTKDITPIISKMIEADRIGDKKLSDELLDLYEKQKIEK